jgi:hypothetical protein
MIGGERTTHLRAIWHRGDGSAVAYLGRYRVSTNQTEQEIQMTTSSGDKRLPALEILRRLRIPQWQVSAHAGVGQSTVSATLNGHIRNEAVLMAVRGLVPKGVATDCELFGHSDD